VLVGLAYMLLISPFLLPDRESPMDELLSHPREVCRVVSCRVSPACKHKADHLGRLLVVQYTITVIVEQNSSIDGKTVGAVGLNAVDGLILVNLIVRTTASPLLNAPSAPARALHDACWFTLGYVECRGGVSTTQTCRPKRRSTQGIS
jgi:hypothetical protein